MNLAIIIKNIRTISIIILIVLCVWFYKDYMYQRSENIRQTENNRQSQIADSIKFTNRIYDLSEIKTYLEYQNNDLNKRLIQDKINIRKIESIVSSNYNYRDTIINKIDVSNLLKSIKSNIPNRTPFIDTTKCLTNKGYIEYQNDSLRVVFTEKEFNNKSDNVAYWERKPWLTIGKLKIRIFGKKEITAKVYNQCGESKTIRIERKK